MALCVGFVALVVTTELHYRLTPGALHTQRPGCETSATKSKVWKTRQGRRVIGLTAFSKADASLQTKHNNPIVFIFLIDL